MKRQYHVDFAHDSATHTLRSTARQTVSDSVSGMASFGHKMNYHKLHVYRDGDVRWTEHINRSDDIVDRVADYFSAIPSVACAGTGSCACNCDYCNEVYSEQAEAYAIKQGWEYDKSAKYADADDAIADAVANSDLSDIEADMLAEFDAIPVGYFNDEDDHAEEPESDIEHARRLR